MADQVDGRPTFPVSAALGAHLRVTLNSSGQLALATAAGDDWIGTTTKETFAAGDLVAITPRYHNGIVKRVVNDSNGAVSVGDVAYGAANGEIGVDESGTGSKMIGVVVNAAAQNVETVIGILPAEGPDAA